MLWLITQGKQSLVNVREVTVKGKTIEGIVDSSSLDQWSKTLGKYESKERAMEIIIDLSGKLEEESNGISTLFHMPDK
ncbi:hypothetical protein [Terribacillus halophilus]|uniref:hypothetical protein n=1 Tax=Terribacillus halophilus TaxID=361279 RepID=UPI000985D6CE|nr:hypothetical protein [Terribacillus halophilus]